MKTWLTNALASRLVVGLLAAGATLVVQHGLLDETCAELLGANLLKLLGL